MSNGNAESRSRWLTYAGGTTLTSVVGTKGAGTVTKTGASTTKSTVQQVRNTTDSVMSNYVNPFGPELAVSHGVHVPHGVLNGPTLKDELLLFAKDFKSGRLNTGGMKVNSLNEIRIINKKYAGETYKLTGTLGKKYPAGVEFSKEGFPDFSPYSKASVEIKGLIGDHYYDFKKANELLGLKNTPKGYTWHHVEDGKTLKLVPSDIHGEVRHTGGASLIKKGLKP